MNLKLQPETIQILKKNTQVESNKPLKPPLQINFPIKKYPYQAIKPLEKSFIPALNQQVPKQKKQQSQQPQKQQQYSHSNLGVKPHQWRHIPRSEWVELKFARTTLEQEKQLNRYLTQ